MGARLVLQVPTADLRHSQAVAATDDQATLAAFAERMLAMANQRIGKAGDVFERELAILQRDQLRARLDYVLGDPGPVTKEPAERA